VLKVILPEHKPVYANLEFRIIKSEFDPNVCNSMWSNFPNNQNGLPCKISSLKIIALSQSNFGLLSLYNSSAPTEDT